MIQNWIKTACKNCFTDRKHTVEIIILIADGLSLLCNHFFVLIYYPPNAITETCALIIVDVLVYTVLKLNVSLALRYTT